MRVLALILCLLGAPALAQSTQDCAVAEGLYEAVLDKHAATGGQVDGAAFKELSEGEKWYWVASKLLAQAYRMNALLADPSKVAPELMAREARVFQVLNAAEPCYRDASAPYVKFAKIPSDEWRTVLLDSLAGYL